MIEEVPVWLLVLILIAVVIAAVQAGIHLAHRSIASRKNEGNPKEAVGSVVGALLGLLAFMLAFTFSMAADRRDSRKALLLEEVNSIGTTYLRAGLIPKLQSDESRALLRTYVELRIEAAENPERLPALLKESATILQELWSRAETLAEADLKNADIVSLYVDSLNETIDLQTSRLTVGHYRIPHIVWFAFASLTILSSLAVGYNFGLHSQGRHRLMTALLAVSFATVTFLILDLDHGNQGWLKVDQRPMYELREQLRTPLSSNP